MSIYIITLDEIIHPKLYHFPHECAQAACLKSPNVNVSLAAERLNLFQVSITAERSATLALIVRQQFA